MPKAWLMQGLIRDTNGKIIERGRPKIMSPALGAQRMKESNDWEILDTEYDAPPDRRHPKARGPVAPMKPMDLPPSLASKLKT